MKQRLDKILVDLKLVTTRSQAESWVKLGKVTVNGQVVTKPGTFTDIDSKIKLNSDVQYVSRAGLKLASVAEAFNLRFKGKIVLDVGSSTGGFTDYVLQNGAKLVYAVDVGTNQLHPKLQGNKQIELHEKTDIRDFTPKLTTDIVVIDVSFISLRDILPHIFKISNKNTQIVAMVKPQFEAGREQINKGVIKNSKIRREILTSFETWVKQKYVILNKKDSDIAGTKGNIERFYLLKQKSIAKVV